MAREALKLALEALKIWEQMYPKSSASCYRTPAITAIKAALAQPVQEPRDIAKLVEGMEVSVDVSTGEHDSGNRLFGTVTLAQENQSSKHGLILLVQEPEPNFNPAPLPAQEPVAWTLLLTGEHHGIIGKAGDQFLGHPKHYERVDVYTTPPQRPWVGLTDDEVNNFAAGCHLGKSVQGAIYEAEAKLKEKNNET